jgi:RNA polymerase sigma factor (sigma-70 family)
VATIQIWGELSLVDDLPIVRAREPFEAFYRRQYRQVLGLAIVLSGNRSVAEELAQEAFLVTLRNWHRVAEMDNPEAWVRTVVANSSVSWFRRAGAQARALIRFGSTPDSSPRLDVEAELDLWCEVRRLPRRQAQAVALVYLNGLSRREVADALGCSEQTVKTHLSRAKQTLAERLEMRGDRA